MIVIFVIPILNPFPGIARHVMNTIGRCTFVLSPRWFEGVFPNSFAIVVRM